MSDLDAFLDFAKDRKPRGRRTRAKGLAGEREVAALWREAGLEVRGLESGGDHLVLADGPVIHSEVKRQERLQLWQWLEQAEAEAPAGTIAVVSFRRSRQPWYSTLRTTDLARMIAR